MLFLYKMLFPILLLLQNQSKIETNKIKKMKKKNHDKFSVEIKKFVEEKQLSQLINFNMFHSLLTDAEKNHLLPFLNEETDRVNLSSVQELFSSNAFREALRTFSDEILYQGMDPLHHPALLSSATSSSHHDVNMNININMNMDKEIMDEEDENDDDDDDDFSPGKKSKPKKKVVKKPLSDLPVKNGYGRSQGNVFELKPSLPLWKQSWFSFYWAYRPLLKRSLESLLYGVPSSSPFSFSSSTTTTKLATTKLLTTKLTTTKLTTTKSTVNAIGKIGKVTASFKPPTQFSSGKKSYKEAAYLILRDTKREMSCQELVDEAVRRQYFGELGKTPHMSMSGQLSQDVKNADSIFQRAGPNKYSLVHYN